MDSFEVDPQHTAVLLVDPYNDFLADGGKLSPGLAKVAAAVSLLDNLRAIRAGARAAGIQLVYVPHHRAEPEDFATWQHATPYQLAAARAQVFAKGSWGGQWHTDFEPAPGDAMAQEHWGSNGFANTDLDLLLRQRGLRRLVLVGLIANTCIESTAKGAVDLGYHVTLVRDATAACSPEAMHAAHELNAPTYAHAVVTTAALLAAFGRGGRRREDEAGS